MLGEQSWGEVECDDLAEEMKFDESDEGGRGGLFAELRSVCLCVCICGPGFGISGFVRSASSH